MCIHFLLNSFNLRGIKMDKKPLSMRLGLVDPNLVSSIDIEETSIDQLPSIVEIQDGICIQTSTRVTEVKRETTDDN